MDEINSDYVILSLTENCKLLQWDIKSGALYSEKIVENPNEKSLCTDVISAQYCSNGQKIVVLCNFYLFIFDSNTGEEIHKIEMNGQNDDGILGRAVAMDVSATSGYVAIGKNYESIDEEDENSKVLIYDINSDSISSPVDEYVCTSNSIEFLKISNNGEYILVVLDGGNEFYDFNFVTDNDDDEQYVELEGILSCANFSYDGKLLLCGDQDGNIVVYHTKVQLVEGGIQDLEILYIFNEVFSGMVSDCRFLKSTLGSISIGLAEPTQTASPDVILTCSSAGEISLLRIDGGVILNIDVQEKLYYKNHFNNFYSRAIVPGVSSEPISVNVIVSKYEGYHSCDTCIMCDDESMIIVNVHNHSFGDNSLICVFDLRGNLLKVLEEFPENGHILSLSSKPINYDIKREKSASLLRSIAINETSSIVESIDALLTNINNNENIEILEKTKRDLLEAQNKRSVKSSRPSTPIEMVFGDQHKRTELMDYIHPKARRPGGGFRRSHKRLVYSNGKM